MPEASVGLPIYNGEEYVEEAIKSILGQTFEDFELILSDNASTDRTREICLDYASMDKRVRYYRNGVNLGATLNYNMTFELSRGRYFKWAAHDDLISPEYLSECISVLKADPGCVLAFPETTYMDANGIYLSTETGDLSITEKNTAARLKRFVAMEARSNDIFWAIFGVTRREVLSRTGLFGRYIANDQVLLTKILLAGPFRQVPKKLYFRRIHPKASTVMLPKINSYKERARWYDTTTRPKVVLPNWRLLVEDLSAIRGLALDKQSKARCYYLIARMFANRWKRLALEMGSLPSQIIVRRTT